MNMVPGQPQHETDFLEVQDEERHIEDIVAGIEPGTASKVLFWGITIFFLVFLIWAAFAEIDRTVRGMGRVISSSELQVVSSLDAVVTKSAASSKSSACWSVIDDLLPRACVCACLCLCLCVDVLCMRLG